LTTKEEVIAQTRIEIFHENWLLGFVAAHVQRSSDEIFRLADGADDSSAANRHKKRLFHAGRQPELNTQSIKTVGNLNKLFI